ncbi:SEC-C metal-binding domain-containing protein [Robertmurraya massiliosenegalensis]|uniref:SEC-C metal-binding domain-containing protein n=1 Tax=Robertmurraya TaxID=2837507 RepID=UPI0039A5FDF0
MPHMPAVCNTCGTIFNSGIFVENSSVTLSGNKSGPCPSCGGWGHIPDGVFNFIGNAIEVLSAPERTVKELQRFSEILQLAQKHETTLEQIEEEIQEETPQLISILDLLPRNREELRADLGIFITCLIMIIQIFLPSLLEEEPTPKIEVNQVINHIYESTEINNTNLINGQTTIPTNNQTIKNAPIRVEKIGRNELCPCGSGKKYKYCHLQLQTQ